MNETYTLEKLFDSFPGGICVPRIQRGYVQGRDDDKGKTIRKEFVPVLVNAVFGNIPLSLDFLYGIADDGDGKGRRLLPLDGQQRLTTLTLLAWLCGKWRPQWRFDYEARRIPQLFMEGLLAAPPPSDGKPSEAVRASGWFLPVWDNEPTVAGMLRMLDALDKEIGSRNRMEAKFGNVLFLLHGIDGTGDTFDHIFRKMNARGKELSAWENMKAMLDKHLDKNMSEEWATAWRDKIDGDWAECIWKGIREDIVKLDNALEKLVRMAYARVFGFDAQSDTLWKMDGKLAAGGEDASGKVKISAFFQVAMSYFTALDRIASCWTDDRRKNALWDVKSDASNSKFWEELGKGGNATPSNLLRMAFLSEPSDNPDEKRRRRVLLNLLDASRGIDAKNFGDALDAGLDFLAGKLALAALENRKVGYSPDQLADERRKSGIDTERIVEFEKDELVHQGSLRFIGWNSFDDAGDIKTRLDSIRTAISEDWIGFYRNLASRIPENKITGKLHVPCRKECIETWREKIFSDVLFVDALALWKSSPNASETIPAWVAHLVELLSKRKVENSTLKKVGGWMFLLQNNENRTPDKSIRLDWNETECKNRQKLSCGQVRWARWGWSWREGNEENVWYNVDDESWWNTVDPPRWTKIEGGEFVMMDRNEHERENRSLLKTATIRYNQTIWPWVESKTDGEWYNVNDTSWLSPAPNRYARGGDGQFVQLPDDEGSA